ncbi:hypothetical protein HKD37_11G032232 [Glycine soja]
MGLYILKNKKSWGATAPKPQNLDPFMSLKTLSIVSQPTLLRASEVRLTGASSKGGKCVESPPTFICGKRRKNRRKPVMKNIADSGVVFTFEEGRQKRGSCSYVPSIEEEIKPT